jgi:phenol/toluene 2-monooxygenase (NADH) P0/A0
MATHTSSADRQAPLDTKRRFVRLRGERRHGFVEFDFAIGEPEVFVELILDWKSFREFCVMNEVEMLPMLDELAAGNKELSAWDWRLTDARNARFK